MAFVTSPVARPSYKAGYAHHAGESANPWAWRGLVDARVMALGPTGDKVFDATGRGLPADWNGVPADDWVVDERGWALDADGVLDHLSVPDRTALNITKEITIAVSYKLTADVIPQTLCAKRSKPASTKFRNWHFSISNGNDLVFHYQEDDASTQHNWTTTSTQADIGVWYDAVMTFRWGDGGSLKMTVNGLDAAGSWTLGDGSGTPEVTPYPMTIGVRSIHETANDELNGRIGSVLVYDRLMTDWECERLSADISAPFRLKPRIISLGTAAGGVTVPVLDEGMLTGGLSELSGAL